MDYGGRAGFVLPSYGRPQSIALLSSVYLLTS